MPTPDGAPTLEVRKVSGSIDLQNVQSFRLFTGRRNVSDPYGAGTATVTGRRPDLLPTLLIGDVMRLRLAIKRVGSPTVDTLVYGYRVRDLQIEYGIVSADDKWTLDLEDGFAYLGRAILPTRTIAAGTNTATAAQTIGTDAGVTVSTFGTTTSKTSAQTVTGLNALEVMQNLANTEYAWLMASDIVSWTGRNSWLNQPVNNTFSDDTTGNLKYNQLRFTSLADNYADKVQIQPIGASPAVTGTGIFSYNLNSFSENAAESQYLAEFVYGILRLQQSRPSEITYLMNGQDSSWAVVGANAPDGAPVTVKFRGTTYAARRIGIEITGNPEATYATVYLMPSGLADYLVLDSPNYGILDTNRLAW